MKRMIRFVMLATALCLPLGPSSAGDDGPDLRLVKILKKGRVGIEQFNRWRLLNPIIDDVNLRGADLRGANLRGANLRLADLSNAKLEGAVFGLSFADEADEMAKAEACRRGFRDSGQGDSGNDPLGAAMQRLENDMMATLACQNAFGVLAEVQASAADLAGANLEGADLDGADFTGAKGCEAVLNAPPDFEARCANPR